MLTSINRVPIMSDETILNGFPRAEKRTVIYFQKERATYIYYGDGEWRSIMNNTDYEYHKEKKKEKEIVW